MNSKIVYIEGNIGSGKSTLIDLLPTLAPDALNLFRIQPEPVETWTNFRGTNLLKDFNDHKSYFGFHFQSVVLLTLGKLDDIPDRDRRIIIRERSLMSARHVFVQNLFNSGYLSALELNILDEYYTHFLRKSIDIGDSMIVYLTAKPETLLNRIISRNRISEQKMNIDYLKSLQNAYESWIAGEECVRPVIKVNTDTSIENLIDQYKNLIKDIKRI